MIFKKKNKGSIIPLFLVLSFAIMVIVLILLDLGMFYLSLQNERNLISISEQSVMTPANAELINNSENPQVKISEIMTENLHKNSFNNDIRVWAYEYPQGGLGVGTDARNRLVIIGVEIEKPYISLILKYLGVSSIDNAIANDRFQFKFVSETEVWRPAQVSLSNGLYTSNNGLPLSFTYIDLGSFPLTLQDFAANKLININN